MNMLARALVFQLFSAAAANFALKLEVDFHADRQQEEKLHTALEGALKIINFQAIGLAGVGHTHYDQSRKASIVRLGDVSTVDSIVTQVAHIVGQVVVAISTGGASIAGTVLNTLMNVFGSLFGGGTTPVASLSDMVFLLMSAPKARYALLIEYTGMRNNGVIDVFGIKGDDLQKNFGATIKDLGKYQYELRIPDSAITQYLSTFDESTVPEAIREPMKMLVTSLASIFPKVLPLSPTYTSTGTSTVPAVVTTGVVTKQPTNTATNEQYVGKKNTDDKKPDGGNVLYYVLAAAGVALLIVFIIIACRMQQQKVDRSKAVNLRDLSKQKPRTTDNSVGKPAAFATASYPSMYQSSPPNVNKSAGVRLRTKATKLDVSTSPPKKSNPNPKKTTVNMSMARSGVSAHRPTQNKSLVLPGETIRRKKTVTVSKWLESS